MVQTFAGLLDQVVAFERIADDVALRPREGDGSGYQTTFSKVVGAFLGRGDFNVSAEAN